MPVHYLSHLFETLLEAQSIDFGFDDDMERRTVINDDLEIPATDFGITKTDQERLIASGKPGAQNYLITRETRFSSTKPLLSEPA